MYGIEEVDALKVKRIAGRIIPAIATTTAAVAGLVSLSALSARTGARAQLMFLCHFLTVYISLYVVSVCTCEYEYGVSTSTL